MDLVARSMAAKAKPFKSRIIVSNKANAKFDVLNTFTERTSRVKYTAMSDFHSPQLVYQNVTTASNTAGDLPNVNAVIYGAAIEYGGFIYPAQLSTQSLVTVPGGMTLFFESIPIAINKGDVFYVRTYTKVNASEYTPVNYAGTSGQGEGYVDGSNLTLYNSAAISAVNGSMTAPVAILGTVSKPTASVLDIGDSIMNGLKDGTSYLGYAYRFCEANSIAHCNMGFPGDRASAVVGNGRRIRQLLYPFATHAIVGYGVNDLSNGSTATVLYNNLLPLWNHLNQLGVKVIQTTITPNTGSSDSFATLANQTISNTGFTGGTASKRAEFNRLIRPKPAPLWVVIDTAGAVESSFESGLWKVNGTANYYTDDGLHPKAPGHDLMLAAIDPALFMIS